MKKLNIWNFGLLCYLSFSVLGNSAFGMGQKGDWIGAGGLGFMLSPTLVMISPELEYVYAPDLTFGSLVQMGFGGDGGLLTTVSGTVRGVYGDEKSKWRPTAQAAFGMALGSGLYKSSVGVHLMASGGIEYVFDKATSIGTMIRLNFTPPINSFFISWPLIIGRFRL